MDISYLGHSCFSITINGKIILFDPFISPNPLAKAIKLDEIKADYILISHGHYDHIADAVSLANQTNAKIISNHEICVWLENQGLTNLLAMNIGGKTKLEFGSVKCVVAIHSSSLPDGSYAGNPMGFVVESTEGNFYYAGDTALTYDMKLIGEYRKIDFAFLPIGDNFTMSADNAIIASDFISCNNIIGMHFNTFPPIKIDTIAAQQRFEIAGKKLMILEIGETISLNN